MNGASNVWVNPGLLTPHEAAPTLENRVDSEARLDAQTTMHKAHDSQIAGLQRNWEIELEVARGGSTAPCLTQLLTIQKARDSEISMFQDVLARERAEAMNTIRNLVIALEIARGGTTPAVAEPAPVQLAAAATVRSAPSPTPQGENPADYLQPRTAGAWAVLFPHNALLQTPIELTDNTIHLGCGDECEVKVLGTYISRVHARLVRDLASGRVFVANLSKTNRLYLNGENVPHGKSLVVDYAAANAPNQLEVNPTLEIDIPLTQHLRFVLPPKPFELLTVHVRAGVNPAIRSPPQKHLRTVNCTCACWG